jgi:hypothetical protein
VAETIRLAAEVGLVGGSSASSLFTRSTTLKKRPRAPLRMQARACKALLAEAAGVQQCQTESKERDGEEAGDDQDHA